ncbi:hypothetical protein [uncultured Erythrobacter sp.]|nr:hypothetical protein [uncultured Erythrobacter sp.]
MGVTKRLGAKSMAWNGREPKASQRATARRRPCGEAKQRGGAAPGV